MFGTTTLAEVKKKLINRFGSLPDFSAEARTARQRHRPAPIQDLSELEKSLFAALEELERKIKRANIDQVDHVDEPMIYYRERPHGGKEHS
ncbi:MAG: hypothetical protein HYX68_23075 [Planctomycetes bacterium]|nr:hypothetical protein [Planctomycetota bacterium]